MGGETSSGLQSELGAEYTRPTGGCHEHAARFGRHLTIGGLIGGVIGGLVGGLIGGFIGGFDCESLPAEACSAA